MKIASKWAAYTIGILAAGLALQLLGSYAVGLWGARIGAAKWLVGVMSKASLADDPVLREMKVAAEMLTPEEAGAPDRIHAALAGLGSERGQFWAWIPADGSSPFMSDDRCRGALVEARSSLPIGTEQILSCDALAVLVTRVPDHPSLVVGFAIDETFADRVQLLTGAESVILVDGTIVATSLELDAPESLGLSDLPAADEGVEVGFGTLELAMQGYHGFDMRDGSESMPVGSGATWFAGTRTFSGRLTIVALVPESLMTLGPFYNTMFTIPVSIVLLLLMGWLVWRLVSRYTRPISALMRSAHAVSEGDLDQTVPVPTSPEMRELCQTYNVMLERLGEAMKLRQQLAREVGRSEVATGVLHNVGNVLNGITVSVGLVLEAVRASRMPNLAKVTDLLQEHTEDLDTFLREDPRGQKLMPYLAKLTTQLMQEREHLCEELKNLEAGVDHVKNVVRTQQSYAKAGGMTERCRVTDLVDDAVRLEAASLENHRIEIVRDALGPEYVSCDKHKTLQILVNLLTNAKQAVIRVGRGEGRITVRSTMDDGLARIEVTDDGVGISDENLAKIFGYGFTTSRDGHGFGLHNSANAANEMGGALRCHSEGEGRGATFTLELPAA